MIGSIFWLCVGSILYTYAGYPALVTLLARLRRPERPGDATPTVTLLIAAYNEQQSIAQKLENSLALDYPRDRLQILVADDGSDDRTPEIVASYAAQGVETSRRSPRRGKIGAINLALAQARGEIIVVSDANNSYNAQAIRALVAPFADPAVGVVGGAKLIERGDGALGDSEGLYWRYESFIKRQESRLGCCIAVTGDILAFRRSLFEPPPSSIINEDFYIAMRIVRRGYRSIYAPQARSLERVSPTAQDEMARRSRIVAGRYQSLLHTRQLLTPRRPLVAWQIISHKFLRLSVPLAMIGALLCNLLAVARPVRAEGKRIARLAHPANRVMLGLQALFYAMAWAGNRRERKGALGKLLYLPAYLVNSNLAALAGLYRFLRGRQSPLWQRVGRREGPAASAVTERT